LLYWEALGVQAAFRYYRGYQERETHTAELKAQLARAQLTALKTQLQPHFLFNTLNAIMVLVRRQNGRQAEEMLARFSDIEEAEERVQYLTGEMVSAIFDRDFEKARSFSNEDRKARQDLALLREKYKVDSDAESP
jgi:hypothetical protein